MKTSVICLAAFFSTTLLLSSCNTPDNSAGSATTATEPGTPATHDMAGMNHSGMDHSAMSHTPADTGSASPQQAAMNQMMQQMHATIPRGNTDYDFARHMLEHHKGAVRMADLELRDGQDAAMRQLATKIKADQQKEIGELEAAADRLKSAPANYKPGDPSDPFTRKMNASMAAMMQPASQPAPTPDASFNHLMTVHHQSAVDMAQAQLDHGQDARLKALARQMIEAQQKEIQQLKDWQAKNANQP